MSVFAEPLAQAREAMSWLKPSRKRDEGMSALDLIEQRAEEMLADPVSWREQTFRLRMEEAEQRAADMEKALNVIEAVAYEGKAGVISETDALRTIQADCSAALSAREEAR